jgi:ribosome-associated translation inhibitor RaiA
MMMNDNLSIAFRHLPPSDALTAHISEEVDRLTAHYGHPVRCRVTVEPYRQMARAKRCQVRVEVALPGRTLVATRKPSDHEGHDDAYLAVRQAFRAVRRQLDRQSN